MYIYVHLLYDYIDWIITLALRTKSIYNKLYEKEIVGVVGGSCTFY